MASFSVMCSKPSPPSVVCHLTTSLSVCGERDNMWGIGDPVQRRCIAFIRGKGCLKFVHLEITDIRLPDLDDEAGAPSFCVDGWALTTWSNNVMSNSVEDWHKECVVQASNITIADMAISRFLEDSGLLCRSLSNEPKAEQINLQNLSMYQPSPCLTEQLAQSRAVKPAEPLHVSALSLPYLVARVKNRHPKAWILAIDMNNGGRLKGAAYFGIQSEYSGYSVIYCPSEISKYMNLTKYMNPATTLGNFLLMLAADAYSCDLYHCFVVNCLL